MHIATTSINTRAIRGAFSISFLFATVVSGGKPSLRTLPIGVCSASCMMYTASPLGLCEPDVLQGTGLG